MKLSKHQKETICKILSGEIYDIFSYINFFNLGTNIKFNKQSIMNAFNNDGLPKKYYYHSGLQCRSSNLIDEQDYLKRLQENQLDPNNYVEKTLELSYNTGIKQETWNGKKYTLDFYEGVYVANSFGSILEFLTLWQFLESEMLILTTTQDFSAKFLGLFYAKEPILKDSSFSIQERKNNIDFNNFTYDDKYYLNTQYVLSREYCIICKDYLDKRIYPSAKLKLFIKRHFMTYEEQAQNRALFAAWFAILISTVSIFLPYLKKDSSTDSSIYALQKDTSDLNIFEKKFIQDLNIIIEDLDSILHEISSDYYIKNGSTPTKN